MTDSPADKKTKDEGDVAESKAVPKPRFDEVNAKYKEAKAQADAALTELNTLKAEIEKKNAEGPDVEKLVQERLRPLQERAEIGDLAVNYGLSTEQAKAVLEIRGKYSGLDSDKALLLAKVEKPELFPTVRNLPGVLPPSGTSPARSANPESKYEKDLEAAMSIQDKSERMHRARDVSNAEFQRRILERKAMGPIDTPNAPTRPQ